MTTDPNLYSVGWICALPTESVAAQVFLDEKYGSPESVSTHDNNDYTLGRIGRHNVVIAVLPDGEYGLTSAAIVAQNMLHSFPHIRIGLMVGIGGGAPTTSKDIRLGDVVVSSSGGGYGGVFQYDFGKTIQEKAFQTTQFLNQPPEVLRTAVSGLKAEHEINGHGIDIAVDDLLQKFRRLQKKYARPESDILFRSHFVHLDESGNDGCLKCDTDPSRVKQRSDRDDEDKIVIHYGLVASANNLMKDAFLRDKLAAENGVLCFEMEAAGLMNHFPCIVVRGICDYADSHKNKEWQGYAAMVAAAYAKQLLLRIVPNRLEAEQKILDIIGRVHEVTQQIADNVAHISSRQRDDADGKILDWITLVDYGKKQSDHFNRHHPGTGQWLLESDVYKNWTSSKGATLFCPGMPGAGKTILTSIIIDDILHKTREHRDVAVVWIYCNFREAHDQRVNSLLATILRQLGQIPTELPNSVQELYHHHIKMRTAPSIQELSMTLQSVASLYSRIFLFVDALDECQTIDGCREKFLQEIETLQAISGMNIFLTSRYNPIISENIKGYKNVISVEIRATDQDVANYVESLLPRLPSFIKRNPELQMDVISRIVNAVGGMFLLAKLYCDSLRSCTTQKKLYNTLENLNKGADAYHYAYTDAMERIQGQASEFKDLAYEALSWITCARRPITVLELRHALAIEPDTQELDATNIPDLDLIISVCAGLVINDEESGIIRLVHYTTQEFFQETWQKWFPDAQIAISRKMLTYLSYTVFQVGIAKTDTDFEERLQTHTLYEYASKNWGYHTTDATITPREDCIQFLTEMSCTEASGQVLLAVKNWPYDMNYSKKSLGMNGLHLVAYFGIREASCVLLDRGFRVDSRDEDGRTPLSWAARYGHKDVVKLLLAANAEVDSQDEYGRTPLSWAAINGHRNVIKLLLAANAEVDSQDEYGRTPLSWAAINGHRDVIKLLLAANAEVDSQDKSSRTPLSWAARYGHQDMVKLLLAANAEVNSQDRHDRTPLSWAVINGHKDVIKLLLAANAEVGSQDGSGRTPLSWAAINGHQDMVELLLAAKAGVTDSDSFGMAENGLRI